MSQPANNDASNDGASKVVPAVAPTVVPMVSRAGRLADALARTRARQEAQARAVLEQREGRIAMLARELDAIADELADELPESETGRFEMVTSHTGDRLVIDPLSYVELDEASSDYRLIRQRRDGEQTILQSADCEEMADGIAAYVAERIVEREGLSSPAPQVVQQISEPAPIVRRGLGFWGGFWLFVLGGVCTATALFAYAWQTYTP